MATKLNGYASIKKDLKFVRKALTYGMDLALQKELKAKNEGRIEEKYVYPKKIDHDADIEKSLYISSIVTYSKAFASTNGRKVTLDHKQIFKTASNELHTVHRNIINQRNSYLAHTGETEFEKSELVVLIPANLSRSSLPHIITDTIHLNSWGAEQIKSYLKVVNWVTDRVIEKLTELSEIVYSEICSISLYEWKKLTENLDKKT